MGGYFNDTYGVCSCTEMGGETKQVLEYIMNQSYFINISINPLTAGVAYIRVFIFISTFNTTF